MQVNFTKSRAVSQNTLRFTENFEMNKINDYFNFEHSISSQLAFKICKLLTNYQT